MTLLPPPGERALPLLAGGLLALAHPPARLLLPAFIGLAPLLVFIAERPPGAAGRWAATRAGILAGVVYFGAQLYWMAVALIRYSALAIPAWAGAVAVLAGLTGAFAWAVHWTDERLGLAPWLTAGLFWTALEWLQGHLGPLSFPWLGLGTALAPFPTLAGAADLVGARGLTVWLAVVNGLVAMLLLRARSDGSLRRPAAALVLVAAVPAGYGAWRAATLDVRPVVRVALVQPNIPEDLKRNRQVALDTSLAALWTLTRQLADGGESAVGNEEARDAGGRNATARTAVEGLEGARFPGRLPVGLVVWPEVALPTDLVGDAVLLRRVRALSRTAGAPIVAGAYGVVSAAGQPSVRNSAFVVRPGGGAARYDKQRLVPFIERIPWIHPTLLGGWLDEARHLGGLDRGRLAPVFTAGDGSRFGILICYESIFAPLARRYRAAGADFLVNVTNDAWYGREEWWGRTTALWQHPAHLVMRAIETRTGVARAANTGISMIVDPFGRVHHATPLFRPAVRTGVVATTDGVTLFVRWGDWLAGLAVAGAVGVLALAGALPLARWRAPRDREDAAPGVRRRARTGG